MTPALDPSAVAEIRQHLLQMLEYGIEAAQWYVSRGDSDSAEAELSFLSALPGLVAKVERECVREHFRQPYRRYMQVMTSALKKGHDRHSTSALYQPIVDRVLELVA